MLVSMAKIRKFGGLLLAQLVFLCFSQSTYAQNYYEENERTFYGGPVIGANFAQVDGDNYAGYYKSGLNVGGIIYAKFGQRFAASMEILYSQKGSRGHKSQKANFTKEVVIQKYGIALDYAEIPLMVHIHDKRKSHFGVGLSFSQLISANETLETNKPVYNDTINVSRYPFKRTDLNFLVGFNLRLYKGLFFNVRYQYSLMPIRTDVNYDYSRAKQYNNLYVVRLAYIFGEKY
jgi:hypothetical protein